MLTDSTIGYSSLLAIVGACVVLFACASSTPPPAVSGDEAPAPHLRGAASEDALSSSHADPVPVPAAGSDVSLGGMLAYADLHSPVLRVARSTRSRARAARQAAAVWPSANPELAVAAGRRWGRDGDGTELELSLSQELEVAGQRAARMDAAARMRELTDADIEQLRWSVHCDVHAMFHRVLIERERATLAGGVVAFQEEVLRLVERQIAAGETAPLTLRLAQAELHQARQVQLAAEQALLTARLRLAQLSGWPFAAPPNPSGAVDPPREPPPQLRLVSVARQQLPSLRAAAARIREAEARAALADREAWPNPSLGVQYRRESDPENDASYDVLMGALSLPIPVFQRNQAARASAAADASMARAELESQQGLLEAQIAEARSEVVAAARRTQSYGAEILPRFEENLKLLRRSFELGEIDLLALSTGRERFLSIQSDALAAQLDYFVALAALERVVGVDLWRDDHHHEVTTP